MESDNRRNTIFPGSNPFPGSDIFPGSDRLKTLPRTGKQSNSLRDEKRRVRTPLIQLPINPSTSSTALLPVLKGSPWDRYWKAYRLELGGSVVVVCKKPTTEDLFTIRSFSGPDADEKLYMLCLLQHDHLLLSYEIFSFEDTFYIVSECMAISLEDLTIARPNELQLAIIIHQILAGISFLASQGLTHGSITCSNILVSAQGVVKIANPECCRRNAQQSGSVDVVALGCVMKHLMEGPTKAKKSGLQNPSYWSADAIEFYSLTLSASPKQLAQHAFLKISPRKEELV
ncbi:MAG: hypothetical protein M1840_002673 [Geoglossum simile]|nr:MAG: hypothetical protein M1840_002673 [Geoglossum simile]